MAHNILTDQLLNQKSTVAPLEIRDKLYDELKQAKALAYVAQEIVIDDKTTHYDYFRVLENILSAAINTYSELDRCLDNY